MSRGIDDYFDDVKPVIRAEVQSQFDGDVRLAFYEQGQTMDVHVVPKELEGQLAEAIDDVAITRYSDLKFTVTKR